MKTDGQVSSPEERRRSPVLTDSERDAGDAWNSSNTNKFYRTPRMFRSTSNNYRNPSGVLLQVLLGFGSAHRGRSV